MELLLEVKDMVGSIKDVDTKSRIVTGYLADFDTEDRVQDTIPKGSFAKSLQERKSQIMFLNQHDWKQPHGTFGVLQEDTKGLYFESKALPNTTYSNDALELYSAGILKEHSIGYQVVKKEMQTKGGRILKELRLFEGSNVTLAANPNTPFIGFKSLTMIESNDKIGLIIKAIRNGNFTDETFNCLEIALKQLQLHAFELGKKSLETEEEPLIKNTPILIEPNKTDIANALKSFTNSIKIN